jgi:uncharacterized DUF497 family protein
MEFRWIDWNLEKVRLHGVTPEEAEYVVERATPPYPEYRKDDRLLVWGPTPAGRFLQVAYVLDPDDTVFVIHARPLTNSEKRRRRRRLRQRGRS